jgi:hypothetical protein
MLTEEKIAGIKIDSNSYTTLYPKSSPSEDSEEGILEISGD